LSFHSPSNLKYFTNNSLRTPEGLLLAYNHCKRSSELFSYSFSESIVTIQNVLVGFSVFCNYVSIHYFRVLTLFEFAFIFCLSVAVTLLWLFALQMTTLCFNGTSKIHSSWKQYEWGRKEDAILMKKTARFFVPFRIRCGSFYHYAANRPIVLLRDIFIFTGRALLTFT